MIVDTGVLYALVDRSDRHHRAAKRLFTSNEPKVVPEPVIVETAWLIGDRLGAKVEVQFLKGLGALTIEAPDANDRARAAEVAEQYQDLDVGYVDSIVVAIAERLTESKVATLDRRHFGVIRPRHVANFHLVP